MILRHALRFGLVGGLATLVHVSTGVTLIHSGWPPLWANAISFLIAFIVSFMGHFGFSFVDQQSDLTTALKRFALVAAGGFFLNETLLALLLSQTSLVPMLALILTTGFAATVTFLLSRSWAFRSKPDSRALKLDVRQ